MTLKKNAANGAVKAELCQEERRVVALQCTYDIEGITDAMALLANDIESNPVMATALVRCFAERIAKLNGLLLSYLSDDEFSASEMRQEFHGRSIQSEEETA